MKQHATPPTDPTGGLTSAWLKRSQAAEYLGYKEGTLRTWASQGKGPRYKKYGTGRGSRVRYAREEVVRFAQDPTRYEQNLNGTDGDSAV